MNARINYKNIFKCHQKGLLFSFIDRLQGCGCCTLKNTLPPLSLSLLGEDIRLQSVNRRKNIGKRGRKKDEKGKKKGCKCERKRAHRCKRREIKTKWMHKKKTPTRREKEGTETNTTLLVAPKVARGLPSSARRLTLKPPFKNKRVPTHKFCKRRIV
jgi:hypothetical protein